MELNIMTSRADKKKNFIVAANAPKRPKQLNRSEAKKVVSRALSDEGSYREMQTLHSAFDHLERQIDFNDVLFGLSREWDGFELDEFNEDEWQWKYKIATQDIEGRKFTVVLAIDPKYNKFTIVTRWPND